MEGQKMTLNDWLDDLCVRFIINIPQEDLASIARICFQIEEAQWFYEDFIRPLDHKLPSLSLRVFTMMMFQHCPLLASFSEESHIKAFEEFLRYKTRVPVRGAIMLNNSLNSAVLVKGWKNGSGWSFPRGKINKDEDDLECAIREVDEETGYDIRAAGLVPDDEASVHYIELSIRAQNIRLYVFRGVPMDAKFQPRTRKEISKIEWCKLADLPAFRRKGTNGNGGDACPADRANKFYMVAPFISPLRKWVAHQLRLEAVADKGYLPVPRPPLSNAVSEEPVTEDDTGAEDLPSLVPPPNKANLAHVKGLMEDTTRELHRLLGVRKRAAEPGAADATAHARTASAASAASAAGSATTLQDKGASLLALLQGRAPADNPVPAQPHAPLDHVHTYVQPPVEPRMEYHPPSFADVAPRPPPHFSLAPDALGGWENLHQQPPVPPAATAAGTHHAAAQPALVHPQPLPPHVRSLLASGSYTPQPAAAGQQQPTDPSIVSYRPASVVEHQPEHDHHHHHQQQQHAARRTHGDAHETRTDTRCGGATTTHRQYENVRQHPQFIQATQMPDPPRFLSQFMSQYPAPYDQGTNYPAARGSLPATQAHQYQPPVHHGALDNPAKTAPPTDKHRSALLDMFRQPEKSPGLPEGSGPRNPQSPGARRGSGGKTSTRSTPRMAAAAAPRIPGAGELQLDLLSMLNGAQPRRPSAAHVSPPPASAGYTPVLLPPGENEAIAPMSSPLAGAAFGSPAAAANGSSTLSSPPASSAFAAPGSLQHPYEHKQKLLSLFGKTQQSRSPLSQQLHHQHLNRQAAAMNLDSSPGPVTPRNHGRDKSRGSVSTAPISPADRDFLLGYLESVTNKSA